MSETIITSLKRQRKKGSISKAAGPMFDQLDKDNPSPPPPPPPPPEEKKKKASSLLSPKGRRARTALA